MFEPSYGFEAPRGQFFCGLGLGCFGLETRGLGLGLGKKVSFTSLPVTPEVVNAHARQFTSGLAHF